MELVTDNVMQIPITDVVFRKDLYPRIEHDQNKAQEYAENIDQLPPIEVNQHKELIDGFHRLTAHRIKEKPTICCFITETKNESEFFSFAIQRNSTHGVQFSDRDRKKCAIRLYNGGEGLDKKEIAVVLSVSLRMVNNYLEKIDTDLREERKETIERMYLECYTAQEIAEVVGLSKQKIDEKIGVWNEMEVGSKMFQSANFTDDFEVPIYNRWTFNKATNKTDHFGKTEQRIVENLLYLYTNPFDIVVDPFAGGGSTLDICKKRFRRCWVSDRKPKPGLEDKIRKLDVIELLPPLNKRWSDVSLTYLDPPYWRQAEGKYSDDTEDLANYQNSDDFHDAMAGLVKKIASKQSQGVIALIIQPTQWCSPDRAFIDHVVEIIKRVGNKKLTIENRVSCPYQTEQYNAQQVNYAKDNKLLLVLTRELIVWRIAR